jgi:hypothetical protein
MSFDSQKSRRHKRCGAKRLVEGNSPERYGIFDSRRQGQMSACERAIFGAQPPTPQVDVPSHEFEMISIRADCGHCITHKRKIIPILGGKGGAYDNRIDVDAIDNDAHCETFVGKRHANDAGLSGAHRGHGVEEVRDAAKPLVNGSYQGAGRCFAMTG